MKRVNWRRRRKATQMQCFCFEAKKNQAEHKEKTQEVYLRNAREQAVQYS